MNTQTITIDFNDYSAVYTNSIANKVTRALLEAFPNKSNHVYANDIEQIVRDLREIEDGLRNGNIMSSENCTTKGI